MSDQSSFRSANAWRSKFRSKQHEQAHDAEVEQNQPLEHRSVFRGKPVVVDTAPALASLLGRLRAAGSFAYDSEFIGELYYVPKLCLIQVSTTEEIALIDPLAKIDFTALWELLADASVEKIVHAGAQDMEPVLRFLNRPAANVVDTQIAAGLARLPYPLSLQRLIQDTLGARIGKGLTFTHWDQRPLSSQQLHYAADDVRYLPAVWGLLREQLEAAGNMAMLREECEAMSVQTPYRFDPETSYLRIRGCGTLDARQLGIIRELAAWRDAAARAADLPPRSFLKDEIMIELARRAPSTNEKLMDIQGLPRPVRAANADAILAAIRSGSAKPIERTGEYRKNEELPRQQFQTDAIHSLVQTLCFARGVDPALAFTRSDLGELLQAIHAGQDIAACESLRLMQGWRRDLIGQPLTSLIRSGGSRTLRVENSELSIERPEPDKA